MSYISNKKDNVIEVKKGIWKKKVKSQAKSSRDRDAYSPSSQRDHWMGYGAMASVMMVLCGALTFQLHQKEDLGGGRHLSSVEHAPEQDAKILEAFNSGKRELASINDSSLEEKEHFEHTILQDYYVSFDMRDFVSEIQLKPGKSPIYVGDLVSFVDKHKDFFPPYTNISQQKDNINDGSDTRAYLLQSSSDVKLVFNVNNENRLVSLTTKR